MHVSVKIAFAIFVRTFERSNLRYVIAGSGFRPTSRSPAAP